jgi:DNA-binding transcriptional LysR family regulator
VSVELFIENAATNIFERGFDAGIRVSEILEQDMVALKLMGPVPWVVAGSPKYLDAHGRPAQPKDLLSHDCICVGAGERIYDRWEFESGGKELAVQVKGSLVTNDATIALDATVAGAGLIYTNEVALSDKVALGELEIVLGNFAGISTGIYLYYPRKSRVAPKLRAFIEHINELKASRDLL